MDNLILDGHKLTWHHERVQDWLAGKRIAPITIDCALTPKCTYRCVYCYGQLQRMQDQPIAQETFFRFLDDAAEIGVKAISLVSDGESTCSSFLNEAIIHAYRNGLDIALGTNGYLLKDEGLAEILPLLTYLRFNISAGERQRYAEIHGCDPKCYDKVIQTIHKAVTMKEQKNLPVTIGLQMVLMPSFADQILPLTQLGEKLEVDYLVIKHCSDDEDGSLGIDYGKYTELTDLLRVAEGYSKGGYSVQVKWSKILTGRNRSYTACYGPPFILQMSGSGLVAPCGMLFNDKYKRFHIGNIKDTSFKILWQSDRYWEVMKELTSERFNPLTDCGTLCLQHKVNEYLWQVKEAGIKPESQTGELPAHLNFI